MQRASKRSLSFEFSYINIASLDILLTIHLQVFLQNLTAGFYATQNIIWLLY